MSNHTELRRLAEAATQGEWHVEANKYRGDYSVAWKPELKVCRTYGDSLAAQCDAAYIAAASPSVVLSLIAEVERLRADKERLDYLDEANARLNAKYGTSYKWRVIMNHNVNRLMLGPGKVDLNDMEANGLPSCRDAIDEARARARARTALGDTNVERT